MAAVVIFGLAIATILTLVVVPSLYVMIEEIKIWIAEHYRAFKNRSVPDVF